MGFKKDYKEIEKIKGIGIKTYEKLFTQLYKEAQNKNDKEKYVQETFKF